MRYEAKKIMKVLIVAGDSGGHIAPACAFCQGLLDKDSSVEIHFVTTDGPIERKLLYPGYNPLYLKKERFRIATSYKFVWLFGKASRIIGEIKPQLIVGFGGYLSIPFILWAHIRGIPNCIHEQNVLLGMANRLLSFVTGRIILSFPPPHSNVITRHKISVLGLPLRKGLRRIDKDVARDYFKFDRQRFTLLIMGGSQGSASINRVMVKELGSNIFSGIQVIHITGTSDYETVSNAYRGNNITSSVVAFSDHMEYALNACDVAISRAGAGILAEIIALGVPSILVPYPYAHKHQYANADYLRRHNAAIVVDDALFDGGHIKTILTELKNNPTKLKQLSQALGNIAQPSAREKFAELAFKLTRWN